MQPVVNIHASCVVLERAGGKFGAPSDAGVLILGESGAGKSDLALRLIGEGARLVADDRCDLFVHENALHARAPEALAGLIEIRGVGILTMARAERARIAIVVRCANPDAIARLPSPTRYRPPQSLGLPENMWPPEIALAPFEPSAALKVIAAAAAPGLT